ncbi:MAG: L,D-transpeptidase [Cyanobacteriota bacterium]|jgi:lipoprotein-anchoring transpeptidase ErfK/SrfK
MKRLLTSPLALLLATASLATAPLGTQALAAPPLAPPPVGVTLPGRPAAATPTAATPAAASTASPGAGSATAAITGTKQIVLELGKRTISLMDNGRVVGSWPVAIGDPSTPTPLGTFSVRNKVINPQYQSTKSGKVNPTIGAQGPLGDRWIGFHTSAKDQFGIHGTPSAWAWTVTSRAAVTHGCVRMLTPHVRQLFEQVEVGTPVVVKR